tara:strand:- start:1155 stop:1547 length:393 start_codon:yes stop_codon:yes gene_type:complete
MNNKLFDLMTAEPVSTATNAHEQMDRLIFENDMAQTNLEDMMYGSITSSENFRPHTGVSQEDLFSMVTGGGAPMVGGMAKMMRPGSTGVSEMVKQLSLQLAKLPKGDAYKTSYSLLEYLKKYQRLSKNKK